MEDFFGPEGILKKRMPNFEYRRQQEDLAKKIDEFLYSDGSLLAAEAPTGVGKTYAMLVPAMCWAEKNSESVLILTSGITLQEQLIQKDIPELLNVLGMDLPFSLLKGRNNYACIRKALEISVDGYLDFGGDKGQTSRDIGEWLYATETGDLSELNLGDSHPARERIASSFQTCLGSLCPHHDVCFYARALKAAMRARLIVANYHVFFSYVLGQGKPFPIPCGLLLCDEAHKIADAARSSTQVTVSAKDWKHLLGNAPSVDKLDKSILKGAGFKRGSTFKKKVEKLVLSGQELFEQIEESLPDGKGFKTFPEDIKTVCSEILANCDSLSDSLSSIEEVLSPSASEDDAPNRIRMWNGELADLRNSLRWCSDVAKYPDWAYWREGSTLKSSCVAAGSIVPQAFDNDGTDIKIVALSATMALDGSFDYWSAETGLTPDDTIILDSPFDLEHHMKIAILDVGVKVQSEDYPELVARGCRRFVQINRGATLILLSSRRLLRAVSEYMKANAERDRINVLVQGDLPRSELLRQFRETKRSVLIGMASFREGIDVPGKALTQVIIDRIPFGHPEDPVNEARSQIEGKSAFNKVVLPEAKMQLRQATGRLIRTNTDTGRVVLMDGRALSNPSWKILESLPKAPCKLVKLTGYRKP